MLSKLKAHSTAYVQTTSGVESEVMKVTLIEHYTCIDGKGKKENTWVVKYEHKGGTYFNMVYESDISMNSSKYDKIVQRQELKHKIELLQTELKALI